MTASVLTFADVMETLSRRSDLSPRTRADLVSALRVFCRVLNIDPATVSAVDLGSLQRALAMAAPERLGLSPARWSVVRSQMLRALEMAGAARPLRTATVTLSPAWGRLLEELPGKGERLALSRLARFCSREDVAPEAVDAQTFARFGEALAEGSLVRNPAKVCSTAEKVWFGLAHTRTEKSQGEPAVSSAPKVRKLGRHPLHAFPQSFQDDLAAYRRWCVSADPLDEQCRPKALRAQTVVSYTSNLHTAADAAVRSGVPIAELTNLAMLTQPEVYLRLLRQMLADTENKATANVHGVATVVPIIARDWLRQAPDQVGELKKIRAKLPKLRPGLTTKNRHLLAAFEDKALLGRFLRLPDDLWREALSEKVPAYQRLVRAQTALLIGILQIVPLRRKNMCAVLFDQHITWPNGPSAEALIQVPLDEMKTDIDFVGELSLELSRRLHYYRTRLAPALTGRVPIHLFILITGEPKKMASVTNRLELFLRRRLGIPMTIHQFRHLAAKLMLDDNPGAYEAVAQLLGHKGTKNVVKFYGGTDTRRATRHHATLIEQLRGEARKRRSWRRRTAGKP